MTLRGFEQVEKRLELLDENFSDTKIDQIVEAVANELKARAFADCPVDTGLLRSSITVERIEYGAYKVFINDVYYAVWVHDGTRRMNPRPFLIGHNSEIAFRDLEKRLIREARR